MSALPRPSSAPGLDGVRVSSLKKLCGPAKMKIFNLFLLCGRLPRRLLGSKTIFIPKSGDVEGPGDFRPISMSSVVLRTFHRVLANRLSKFLSLSMEQRAFIESDGVCQNIFLLDAALHHAKNKYRDLFMASMDIRKAFDSVSHSAIVGALRATCADSVFIEYLEHLYTNSYTHFVIPGVAEEVHPTCGVRQGDPLSPLLFNLVLDGLVRSLSASPVGFDIGSDVKVACSAFADDLILFASTRRGLQQSVDDAVSYLERCNLYINPSKSFTVTILANAKLKKTKVGDSKIDIRGLNLPPKNIGEQFKYLGVYFDSGGLLYHSPVQQIRDFLLRLQKAPLKPQQRLFILRNFVFPRLFHLCVLSRVRVGTLRKTDVLVRAFVRRIVNLPADCPNSYIHAAVKDGGLGVPCLRLLVPVLRLRRLGSLRLSLSSGALGTVPGSFLDEMIAKVSSITTSLDPESMMREALYASVDGSSLRDSSGVPSQHSWIGSPTLFLSGKDYINCNKLRINALPCRSRVSRGRPTNDRFCRAGCPRIEDLAHILQSCPRTHGKRVARHNAIANYIIRGLRLKNFVVHEEPVYETDGGRRKPDLVASRDDKAYIVDIQIVDPRNISRTHQDKLNYYRPLQLSVADKLQVSEVDTLAVTLNWRGCWHPASAKTMLEAGLIKKGDLRVISTRVLVGGLACFRTFNNSCVRSTQAFSGRRR